MTQPASHSVAEDAARWYGEQSVAPLNDRGNFATRVWGRLRGTVETVRNESGIKERIRNLQKEWLGDLAGKRVLDLGCGGGNSISLYMAEKAADYVGFDLSPQAIAELRQRLDKHGFKSATTVAGDFLAESFPYGRFDVVYANSIIHHFRPLSRILEPLYQRTNPGARVVIMDPLQTSLVVRTIRGCFHRFRSDAEWNWPFTRASLKEIEEHFEIERVRGFFGRSKWAVPFAMLPFGTGLGVSLAARLDQSDERQASELGRRFWSCNSAVMAWRRRGD
jgi:SAM-dependent methyltransferase